MKTGTDGRANSVTLRTATTKTILSWSVVWLWALLHGLPLAMAEHEADHRFMVEGSVCGVGGEPVSGVEIVAKDARISLARTTLTDDRGHYEVRLHLHNENKGDPIVVYVKDRDGKIQQERQVTADFDPRDVHTERRITVNFGTGCEAMSDEPPAWVYYGAGLAVLAGGAWAGVRLLRGRKRQAGSHKGRKR